MRAAYAVADAEREKTLRSAQRVHMVGIGGSGVSALASLLLQMGKQVRGSEVSPGPATEQLRMLGATTFVGHAAEHVGIQGGA